MTAAILLLSLTSLLPAPGVSQDRSETLRLLRLVADRALKETTFQFTDTMSGAHFSAADQAPQGAVLTLTSPYNDWRYWNGVLGIAMTRLGESLPDSGYSAYQAQTVSFVFDNVRYFEQRHRSEDKWQYPFGQFFIMEELDDCGAMGAATIEVHQRSPQHRYREYLDRAIAHIRSHQHRLADGTLVRGFPRKWTLWADDLFMSLAFLARWGEDTGDPTVFDDAALQVKRFHAHLFDERVGLMHHCWYADENVPGVAFWGRGNGWALLAQVELLDRLPQNHSERPELLALLRRHMEGIKRFQSKNGLWHQLLDKEDSYLETSCSAMFTYAIARSVNKGYIDQQFAEIARRGWEGIRSKIHPDGQIEGICAGTSVSDDLRDYYRRPTPLNDVHGIGTVLLAGSEILALEKTH